MTVTISFMLLIMATAGDDPTSSAPQMLEVKVLSITGQTPSASFPELQMPIDFITLDKEGKRLAHRKGDEIWIWDIESRMVIKKLPIFKTGELWVNCAFLPSGQEIVVCRENGLVTSVDIDTQRVTREWNLVGSSKPPEFPLGVMMSSDGKEIGIAGEICAVWNQEARKGMLVPTKDAGNKGYHRFGKFLPNGKEFIIAGPGGFQLFTVNPLRLVKDISADEYSTPRSIDMVAWSPDARYFATGNRGNVTLWDRETGKALTQERVFQDRVRGIAFLSGGKRLVIAGSNAERDSRIYILNTATGRVERACKMICRAPMSMVVSPDEKTAYFGTEDGIKIYELPRISEARVGIQ